MNAALATRFANSTRVLRRDFPLTEDEMRRTAPSIFAQGKHTSRSERYTYIPTIEVLRGLRREGFEPFMVAQGHSRIEGKADQLSQRDAAHFVSHRQRIDVCVDFVNSSLVHGPLPQCEHHDLFPGQRSQSPSRAPSNGCAKPERR